MRHWLPLLCLLMLLASPVFGDRVFFDGFEYPDVTVNGCDGESLLVTVKAGDKRFPLAKVQWMDLTAAPRFVDAEKACESDPKKAAAIYRECIRAINDPQLKLLAELRAVAPTDADGRYVEALADFLDVLATNPTEGTWKLRPTHLPGAGSTMLGEAAERIQSRLVGIDDPGMKKNLKTLQLELYTKAGDPRADALVKELTTGIVESDAPKPAQPATEADSIEPIQAAIKSNNFAGAISKAETLLPSASDDGAIRLYELMALAYQGQNSADAAASTLLRIPAFYPASTSAPTALLMAAEIEKRQNHAAEAQRLYQEIREKYPTSPEAIKAGGK